MKNIRVDDYWLHWWSLPNEYGKIKILEIKSSLDIKAEYCYRENNEPKSIKEIATNSSDELIMRKIT